jgi:hypothetical protein
VQVLIERGNMNRSHIASGKYEGAVANKKARKKKAKTGPSGDVVVGSMAPSFKPGEVAVVGDLFKGKRITVLLADKQQKKQIEGIIQEQGGEVAAFPLESETICIISEPDHVRVSLYIQDGKYDIVRVGWVFECLEQKRLAPFMLRNMIYQTEETKQAMLLDADMFGDSYTTHVTVPILKVIFLKTKFFFQKKKKEIFASVEVDPVSGFNLNHCFTLQSEIFDDRPPFSLFSGLVFYLDPSALASLELTRLTVLYYQGAVAKKLTHRVTHVIMKESYDANYKDILAEVEKVKNSHKVKIHIVRCEWVLESAEQGERLVESSYAMSAVVATKKRLRNAMMKQKDQDARAQEILVKSMSASLN